MLNAFQSPQSVALIGATSEIGQSILKHLPQGNLETCFLLARDSERAISTIKGSLRDQTKLIGLPLEAQDLDSHPQIVDQLFADGDLDIAVIATGVLGNDPSLDTLENAVEVMKVNYLACANLMLLIAEKMKTQGHGQILVISSFAQTRPRVDNFVYGSSKAGLDFLARGLNEKLQETGVSVKIIRPGFVRTRMTKDLSDAPFAISPDLVGELAIKLLKSGDSVGYAPSILKWVALIFTHLPKEIFRRLSKKSE